MNNDTNADTDTDYKSIPPIIGQHCILDIKNIVKCDVLDTVDGIKKIMSDIAIKCGFHVVNEAGYQFHPRGATWVYVLSESHMSFHTYPEYASCYVDIFTCGTVRTDMSTIYSILQEHFGGCDIHLQIIMR